MPASFKFAQANGMPMRVMAPFGGQRRCLPARGAPTIPGGAALGDFLCEAALFGQAAERLIGGVLAQPRAKYGIGGLTERP